jgi:hypothetical protein
MVSALWDEENLVILTEIDDVVRENLHAKLALLCPYFTNSNYDQHLRPDILCRILVTPKDPLSFFFTQAKAYYMYQALPMM